MDYKKETIKVYNEYPEYFDEKFGEYTNNIIKEEREELITMLPKGVKVLDLGSGTGNHALFLKNHGFDVLCVDISDKMLEKCREKGLKTRKMDFEELKFPEKSFDIVWAYTSLLHIPKKNLPKVLRDISKIIKDKGIFMISMKEGDEEKMFDFEKGGRRWFSLYSDEELRFLLKKEFEIIKHWRVPIPGKVFLDYLCKKKIS